MKTNTKKLVLSGLFLALGLLLPFLTGQIPQIGNMLCPMHLPVFLCGMICGWPYGALIGLILPPLRFLLDAAHLPNRPCHGAGAVHLRTGQRTSLPAFTAQRQKYLPQPDRRDGFRPYHLGDCTLYLCRSVLQRVWLCHVPQRRSDHCYPWHYPAADPHSAHHFPTACLLQAKTAGILGLFTVNLCIICELFTPNMSFVI